MQFFYNHSSHMLNSFAQELSDDETNPHRSKQRRGIRAQSNAKKRELAGQMEEVFAKAGRTDAKSHSRSE